MSSVFKIYSPEDCDFYYDGELQGHIDCNSKKAFRFEVERKGVYRLEFINSEYQTELMMKVSIDADEEREVELDFSEVNEPVIREREERIIIAIEHDYKWEERLPEEIISAISKNEIVTIPKGARKIGYGAFRDCSSPVSITIPDTVTEIGGRAFQGCSNLKTVTIPNGVTEIGHGTFGECRSLTSVTIPNSVKKIGAWAFYNCSRLTSIIIPNSVTMIDAFAFEGCSNLISITIPDSITKIEREAFALCSSLNSITIPNSVTEIEDYAFCYCSSLNSITIPDTVTKIGLRAFEGCSSLTAFYGKYASYDSRCLIKDGILLAFASYDITKYTILNSVTEIEYYAFASCNSLKSITIPNSVKTIGQNAFEGCSSLTSVYCKAHTPPKLGYKTFYNNTSDRKIFVPKSEGSTVLEAYKSADWWKDYADSIEEYDFDNE